MQRGKHEKILKGLFWASLLSYPLSLILIGICLSYITVYIFHQYEPKWGPDYDFGLNNWILIFLSPFGVIGYLTVIMVFWRKVSNLQAHKIVLIGSVSAMLSLFGSFLFQEWLVIGLTLISALSTALLLHLFSRKQIDSKANGPVLI